MSTRPLVKAELQEVIVPLLRARGFTGSFPHFRRIRPEATDLLSFQFDKYGGAFTIELGHAPPGDYVYPDGDVVPVSRLTAWHLPAAQRARLQRTHGPCEDGWFRYDDGTLPEAVVREAVGLLDQADQWWSGHRHQPNIR